jgi:hypothetical protein
MKRSIARSARPLETLCELVRLAREISNELPFEERQELQQALAVAHVAALRLHAESEDMRRAGP